jgi:hypothetical protein
MASVIKLETETLLDRHQSIIEPKRTLSDNLNDNRLSLLTGDLDDDLVVSSCSGGRVGSIGLLGSCFIS